MTTATTTTTETPTTAAPTTTTTTTTSALDDEALECNAEPFYLPLALRQVTLLLTLLLFCL